MARARSRRRAFTLIELLVVVAIITVLIGILLPTLKNAREQGKLVACAANIRQLAMSMETYADSNAGFYLAVMDSVTGARLINSPSEVLKDYMAADDKSRVWRCPADSGAGVWSPTYLGDPVNYRSYAANGYVIGMSAMCKRTRVVSPARTLSFNESWVGFAAARVEGFLVDNIWDQVSRSGDSAVFHMDKNLSNYAFCDGHVERLKWRDVSPTGMSGKGMYQPDQE